MNKREQFLLKRELGRLLMDYNKCSNPFCRVKILEEIKLLRKVIARNSST
jgi:hypothetical protein